MLSYTIKKVFCFIQNKPSKALIIKSLDGYKTDPNSTEIPESTKPF